MIENEEQFLEWVDKQEASNYDSREYEYSHGSVITVAPAQGSFKRREDDFTFVCNPTFIEFGFYGYTDAIEYPFLTLQLELTLSVLSEKYHNQ